MKNFAISGVGGYVAPRHLRAIRATNGRLVAAVDVRDSVGILDQSAHDVPFFTDFSPFAHHLTRLKHGPEQHRVHYLSVCAPNHLHEAHCRAGLEAGADVICEKPLVVEPRDLTALEEHEARTGRAIFSVLQLRVHPLLRALRESLAARRTTHDVVLTYVTPRGPWYDVSWKGDVTKSGGLSTNIGIHLFDLLLWLFGRPEACRVHLAEARRMSGFLALERARVRWFLSVEARDLPSAGPLHRSLVVDHEPTDFTEGFGELHTRVYEEILAGRGPRIVDARPSIELAHQLRAMPVSREREMLHPFLR